MMEWKPIESAPKDRSKFLAWNSEAGEVCICRFSPASCVFYTTEDQTGDSWRISPRYWMPLPPPPVDKR
jgi:hypothetical protein